MPTTYTVSSSRSPAQSGLARLFAEISALVDSTVEVFTEAFDLSSEARSRFPSAD